MKNEKGRGKRTGYIKLFRSIEDNWMWNEKRKFSKAEAFIYMLLAANHKERKVTIGNEMLTVKRGAFITSQRKLLTAWGWGTAKVRAFLDVLKKDGMIQLQTDRMKTVISIINYETYQDADEPNRPRADRKTDREQTENRPPEEGASQGVQEGYSKGQEKTDRKARKNRPRNRDKQEGLKERKNSPPTPPSGGKRGEVFEWQDRKPDGYAREVWAVYDRCFPHSSQPKALIVKRIESWRAAGFDRRAVIRALEGILTESKNTAMAVWDVDKRLRTKMKEIEGNRRYERQQARRRAEKAAREASDDNLNNWPEELRGEFLKKMREVRLALEPAEDKKKQFNEVSRDFQARFAKTKELAGAGG